MNQSTWSAWSWVKVAMWQPCILIYLCWHDGQNKDIRFRKKQYNIILDSSTYIINIIFKGTSWQKMFLTIYCRMMQLLLIFSILQNCNTARRNIKKQLNISPQPTPPTNNKCSIKTVEFKIIVVSVLQMIISFNINFTQFWFCNIELLYCILLQQICL